MKVTTGAEPNVHYYIKQFRAGAFSALRIWKPSSDAFIPSEDVNSFLMKNFQNTFRYSCPHDQKRKVWYEMYVERKPYAVPATRWVNLHAVLLIV